MEHIQFVIQNRIRSLNEAFQRESIKPKERTRFYLPDFFIDTMLFALVDAYGRTTANNITKIFLVLARCSNKEGIAYPGYKLIMRKTCIKNQNTVSKCLKIMEALKMFVKESGGGRSIPNIYKLLHFSAWIVPKKPEPQSETVLK